MPTTLLVVGAGPTGLALALQAQAHGARVRIVDRRAGPAPSRALIMHARTLEGLRPLGVVEPLLDRSDVCPAADIHLGGRVVRAQFGHLALSDTAFPHLTLVRQADVEAVLAAALVGRGITIERSTAVTAIREDEAGDSVVATLQSTNSTSSDHYDYIAGCDGQASLVRAAAGVAWRGRRYSEEVVLADLELDGDLAANIAHVVVGSRGVLLVFALGERATWRLLATQPAHDGHAKACGQPGPPVERAWLETLLEQAGLPARVSHVAWSARYPLQIRLAAHFRKGRLFLAGDAAHAHSPALGQGMNLGIQDALNLGWKVAFAASATGDAEALLESYERERRPFDRRVLALTHLAFWAEAGRGRIPIILRTLAPLAAPALPALLRSETLVAELVRFISQLGAGYRDSPISVDSTPLLRRWPAPGAPVGDRTVEVNGRGIRLQTLLAQPGVHVLLERAAPVPDDLSLGPLVRVHRLTDAPGTGVVVVRPDGFVGFRAPLATEPQVSSWLARIGAVPNTLPSPEPRSVG